jgi:hypothetical protein
MIELITERRERKKRSSTGRERDRGIYSMSNYIRANGGNTPPTIKQSHKERERKKRKEIHVHL